MGRSRQVQSMHCSHDLGLKTAAIMLAPGPARSLLRLFFSLQKALDTPVGGHHLGAHQDHAIAVERNRESDVLLHGLEQRQALDDQGVDRLGDDRRRRAHLALSIPVSPTVVIAFSRASSRSRALRISTAPLTTINIRSLSAPLSVSLAPGSKVSCEQEAKTRWICLGDKPWNSRSFCKLASRLGDSFIVGLDARDAEEVVCNTLQAAGSCCLAGPSGDWKAAIAVGRRLKRNMYSST